MFLVSIVIPPGTSREASSFPEATITSANTQSTTQMTTVVETQTQTVTITITTTTPSGSVKLYPDLGVRPPPTQTSTPFHVGIAFTIKAHCSYHLTMRSTNPIRFVKILTPSDWSKKQADPEDETIAPLAIWSSTNTLDQQLNLDSGDYVLYFYNSAGTVTINYGITQTCSEAETSTTQLAHTDVKVLAMTILSTYVEPSNLLEQFWLLIPMALVLVTVAVIVRRRNMQSRTKPAA